MKPRYIQDSFTRNFHFPPVQDDDCADLADVSLETLELRVSRSTKNIERLPEFGKLERLRVSSMKTDITKHISCISTLKILSLGYCRTGYTDLSPLSKLSNLKCLILCELRQPDSIEFLRGMRSLIGLEIDNLRKVRDLTPIASLHKTLRELKIETGGPLSGTLAMKSLLPLSSLEKLEYLWLYVLAEDRSLEPLAELQSLRELSINAYFRWEEYAKLDARLPKTHCCWFKKKIINWEIECTKCGTESKVGIPGKGKRMVCSKCDPAKVDDLIACYDEQYNFSRNGNW